MRYAASVLNQIENAKVEVFFADRGMTGYWNERKSKRDLRYFCGWYWYIATRANKAATAEHGPFRSKMAAYRDAYYAMQIR